jgi:site-specific DNA-methyltransferase (cytosine-N4-specific)
MIQMAKDGIKVQTCITSPPYYGLRDYGTATWIGGNKDCEHEGIVISNNRNFIDEGGRGSNKKAISHGDCVKCEAKRQDMQIGNEQSPQEFIENLVKVFACVWDLLKDDGTLWVNLGDSYANNSSQASNNGRAGFGNLREKVINRIGNGYKQKDLMGMPWRLAFALQDFGWYLRQDIIWHKPNPMPESVKDRCTKSHEYIFLLSKKPHYYFDNEAIKESAHSTDDTNRDRDNSRLNNTPGRTRMAGLTTNHYETKNKRDVWTVATKPYSGAHFAVYPEELIEPCVLASTKTGDIVLDPFFGSGTTGAVAQKLGRKWIGCELNKEYEALQNERLSQQGLEL